MNDTENADAAPASLCSNCTWPTDNPAGICVGCRTEVVTEPSWLIANGTRDRFEVLRSPLVEITDEMYSPVGQFIADHGLVLAARETFEDHRWMRGTVEMSVYTPPAARNASYADLAAFL